MNDGRGRLGLTGRTGCAVRVGRHYLKFLSAENRRVVVDYAGMRLTLFQGSVIELGPVRITFYRISGARVKYSIDAPPSVPIVRVEGDTHDEETITVG